MQIKIYLTKFRMVVAVVATTILLTTITACGGSGGGSSGGSTPPDPQAVNLGILDNSGGAAIMSSSGSYTLSGNQSTTGVVGINGGTNGFTGTLTLSIAHQTSQINVKGASNLPTIELATCILTAGNSIQRNCSYKISTTTSVLNGTYSVIPTFTVSTGHQQQLKSINLTITGGLNPTAGSLSIIPNAESLIPGESTTATVVLSGSIGIFESINVTVGSTNSSILSVTPTSCQLSTENNNCQLTITGLVAGNANVTASANGYQTAQITLTVSTIKSYVYAIGNNSNINSIISMYGINPNTGQLISLNSISPVINDGLQELITDNTGRYVYAPNSYDNTILMFRVEPSTGMLTPLTPKSVVATGNFPTKIAIDPNGPYVYVLAGTAIDMYSLDSDTGLLAPLSPESSIPSSGQATICIIVDPTGRFTYVVNSQNNTVSIYSIESTGVLNLESTVMTGHLPARMAIDPTGMYAYVTNSSDNSISMYLIESSTGLLIPLTPSATATGNSPRGITIDPTGRYVYVTNLGSNSVSMYKLNSTTGLLTPLTPATSAVVSQPWGIIVDPTGQYAYVTNALNTIEMYGINQRTGQLTALSPPTTPAGILPQGITIATPRTSSVHVSPK